jgi:hypothetical protein
MGLLDFDFRQGQISVLVAMSRIALRSIQLSTESLLQVLSWDRAVKV